eukprot:m.11258 g.11258  ORF g.11258 m.11258 type:complete len:268 (-) comp6442_c0_seq2:178-981(-)
MNIKLLCVLAIAALLLARVPSSFAAADDLDDDTVEGEEVFDDKAEDIVVEDEADEDISESDIEDLELGPASAVKTTAIFPTNPNLEFPAGGIISALVGLENTDESPFTIMSIEASIRNPLDYSQSFQNFSVVPIELSVDSEQQATFNYKFRTSDRFEPREVIMTVLVHLKDSEEGHFVNAAFNQTVKLVDAESSFDVKSLFVYLALAAAGALFYLQNKREPETVKKPAAQQVETGTKTPVTNEWLTGTNVDVRRSRKTSERSQSGKQ